MSEFRSYGSPKPEQDAGFNPVLLTDYEDLLQKLCPGMIMQTDLHGGVQVLYQQRLHFAFNRMPNADSAKNHIRALAEEARLTAIREIGIRPMLDAYERQIKELQESNIALKHILESVRAELTEAQNQIYDLTHPEEDND